MRIFQLLKSRKLSFYLLLVLLGIGNSLIYSAILYFINHTISNTPINIWPGYDWVVYLLVIAVSAACNIISQRYLVIVANETLVNYENSILQKVKHATYEKFEKMGKQRIYSALGDSWVLAEFPRTFVASANTLIIVLCSIVYMFTVNVWVSLTFTFFLALLSYGFIRSGIKIKNEFSRIQSLQDRFYNHMADFLDGNKEVKMRSVRTENILDKFIRTNRDQKKRMSIQTYTKDTMFGFISRFTWYLLIGSIIFLFPMTINLSLKDMTVCLLIVLHMLEAMNFFLGNIPFYFRVETALKKMDDLNRDVQHFEEEKVRSREMLPEDEFEYIRFENVVYEYYDDKNDNQFVLGPLNLELRRGETLFIEGGNGSGKSTFVNILTGLYRPLEGNIYYNGMLIRPENYESYMNKISAVFTSNYLFSENYDMFDIRENNSFLNRLLDMVQLRHIVRIDKEKKWIGNQLSKGQQKRLALVYALMEERELLILDEWAAEQDPGFRAYFYNEMLQRLKEMGKTIILVTHDDRYISKANRVIKFEDGMVTVDSYSDEVPFKETNHV